MWLWKYEYGCLCRNFLYRFDDLPLVSILAILSVHYRTVLIYIQDFLQEKVIEFFLIILKEITIVLIKVIFFIFAVVTLLLLTPFYFSSFFMKCKMISWMTSHFTETTFSNIHKEIKFYLLWRFNCFFNHCLFYKKKKKLLSWN